LQATKLLAQINGKLQKVKLQRENVSNLLRQPALFAFTPVLQWPLFKVYGGKTVCGGNFGYGTWFSLSCFILLITLF